MINQEIQFWEFIAKSLKSRRDVMLLVVADSAGSSPGRRGFKMAVTSDKMRGSIGGGIMEINLVELAKKKLQSAKNNADPEIIEQNHRKTTKNPSGMICSGNQKVILYKLSPPHLLAVRAALRCIKHNLEGRLLITRDEFQISSEKGDFDFRFEQKDEIEFVYEENLGYKNELFIIGGGHCALALSELMSKMDFHISLLDDRAGLNTFDKNDFVHEKRVIETYEKINEHVASGENVYVVVMTLGYKFDEMVVKQLLGRKFKYFGVLGSRAKMKVLLRSLENEGFSKESLNRIHTPIGLQINSRTPQEIAVSIAAEIIAVKNAPPL